MPKLYIIAGCNGSGKTTASYALLPELLGCRTFVNSDEFAKALSPFGPEQASIQASRLMVKKIDYLLKRNADFGIETTLATRSLLKIVRYAQSIGYSCTLLFFWLNSPDLAISRIRDRVAAGGHNIPEDTVKRRYRIGLKYFFNDYAPIAERWILADNSQIPFRVIAEGSKEEITIMKDEDAYTLCRNIATEAGAPSIG